MFVNMDPLLQKPTNPQVIFAWKAPLRAYKKRGAGILRFYVALSFLLTALVFLFGDKILMLPIWAIMFLFYTLTITPPPEVENKITKFGIETAGNTYRWDFLSYFYFSKRFDYHMLVIVSTAPYHYHIYLVVDNDETMYKLAALLSEHIIYQENPQKTFTDKLIESFSSLMPKDEPIQTNTTTSVEKRLEVALSHPISSPTG